MLGGNRDRLSSLHPPLPPGVRVMTEGQALLAEARVEPSADLMAEAEVLPSAAAAVNGFSGLVLVLAVRDGDDLERRPLTLLR